MSCKKCIHYVSAGYRSAQGIFYCQLAKHGFWYNESRPIWCPCKDNNELKDEGDNK